MFSTYFWFQISACIYKLWWMLLRQSYLVFFYFIFLSKRATPWCIFFYFTQILYTLHFFKLDSRKMTSFARIFCCSIKKGGGGGLKSPPSGSPATPCLKADLSDWISSEKKVKKKNRTVISSQEVLYGTPWERPDNILRTSWGLPKSTSQGRSLHVRLGRPLDIISDVSRTSDWEAPRIFKKDL